MMAKDILAVLAAAFLLISGCAHPAVPYMPYDTRFETKDTGAASRYMFPSEGVFYAYGNFCGPGRPFAERDPDNLQRAAEIKPVDTLDYICKLHDMCYMRFGVDLPKCDRVIIWGMDLEFATLPMPLAGHCDFLGMEIGSALLLKNRPSSIVTGIPLAAPILLAYRLSAKNTGFPREPGHCVADFGSDANAEMGMDAFLLVDPLSAVPKPLQLFRIESQIHNKSVLDGVVVGFSQLANDQTCEEYYISGDDSICRAIDIFRFADTGRLEIMSDELGQKIFGR